MVVAFLSEAHKRNVLRSSFSSEDMLNMLTTQYKRAWNVCISRNGSKAYRLKHDGRYIRRPPIAQHRLTRVGNTCLDCSHHVPKRSYGLVSSCCWISVKKH